MKGPIVASAVVLVLGGLLGIRQQSQVRELHDDLDALYADADRSGVALRMSTSSARRVHVEEDRKAATMLNEVTNLLGRAHAIERAGGKPDKELQQEIVDLTVRLMELSPANMRKVLAGLRDDNSISDETKTKVIGMSILFVSSDHPEDALLLYQESKDVLGKGSLAGHVVTSSLQSWAKINPMAAAAWLKENHETPPGLRREEMAYAVLGGAAENDPAMAFRMLSMVGLDDQEEACDVIASTVAGTKQGREALLAAMRDHLSTLDDPAKADGISAVVMESVARGVDKNSFDEVSGWLDQSRLSENELQAFAGGLSWFSTGKETGSWLEWMEGRLPAEKLAEPVEGLMGDWVEEDYLAAGQWLTQVPDGSLKTPAVKAYAEAVAAYDPEVATQWAMTIKDSNARLQTLRAIHTNWPADDEEGAARFAARHGLEH